MVEKVKSYSFREVKVFPPIEKMRYFQLFADDSPLPFVYSEKHLEYAFNSLNSLCDD